jgi:molybdate transport system substrate-binding protein
MIKKVLPFIWLAFVVSAFLLGWWLSRTDLANSPASPVVTGQPTPEPLRLAVAANFAHTAARLADAFEQQTGTPVTISTASSGTLFAQIKNGLPYDVFLSADSLRPQKLLQDGLADAPSPQTQSPLTYAIGQLLLWLPQAEPSASAAACLEQFKKGEFRHLVLANPQTAPYGQASEETLQHLGSRLLDQQRITAENIAQVFRLAHSGHAEAAFIAASQWQTASQEQKSGCVWPVPAAWHSPLRQQAVVLARSPQLDKARQFLDFLQSEPAQKIIRADGYGVE